MQTRPTPWFILLVCVLLASGLASSATAQVGSPSPNRGPTGLTRLGERSFSITGRVVDETTGEGLENAHVSLGGSVGVGVQELFVDATGWFRFTDLSRGTYYVRVSHPAYEDQEEMVQVASGPVGGLTIFLRRKPQASAPVLIEPLDANERLIPKAARKEFEHGAEQYRQNNFAQALLHFEKALELYPDYASAWNAKGLIHLRQNDVESARPCFERAVEINPNTATPRVFLGGIYNADRRYAEARDHLLRALQLNPKSGLAHFEISRSYWALNDIDKAEEHISQAHALAPAIPQVHMMRANVFIARRDYKSALAEMDEFLAFVPRTVPEGPLAVYVREHRAQLAQRLTKSEGPH